MQDSPGYTTEAPAGAAACDVCGKLGSVRYGSLRRYLAVAAGGAVERRTACADCAGRAEARGWIRESPRLGEWSADLDLPRPSRPAPTDGNGGPSATPEALPAQAAAACAICGRQGLELRPHLAVSRGEVARRGVCESCRERARELGWLPEAPGLAAVGAELGVAAPAPPAPWRPEPAPALPAARPLRRRALAAVLRTLSSILVTTGILGLADVVITLTWQEPITAIVASVEQGNLSDEVAVLEEEARLALATNEPEPVEEVAAAMRGDLKEGDAIGRLSIEEIGIDFALVEDAGSDASLRKGPARYTHTYLPGEGGTMGVAGHRTTYDAPFNDIDSLEKGDEIVVDMPYGDFTYFVKETEIVLPDEVDVLDPGNREKIVLTACHPLYSAAQRIVVTGILEHAESDRRGVAI